MIKIWGRRTSSNVQALMWCIGELGLTYKRYDVGHRYGGNDTSEFLSMNPNGTVPVLRDDDGEPLWETGAILRYLADRYGSNSFWPRDILPRAKVDKWAEWSKLNVTLSFTGPIFWRVVRTAPSKRNEAAIREAITYLDRFLDVAEVQLSRGPFLAGEDFTLADIQFGHVLFRYFDISIARKARPALRRYYDALTTRSAFREHVMVSYDELRVSD
ncbi:glutathione S-transferase family protein [Azospirillum endophyticum]